MKQEFTSKSKILADIRRNPDYLVCQFWFFFAETISDHCFLCPRFSPPQPSSCSCAGGAPCGPPSGRSPRPSTSLATWASPSTTSCSSPQCSTYSGKWWALASVSEAPNPPRMAEQQRVANYSAPVWNDDVFFPSPSGSPFPPSIPTGCCCSPSCIPMSPSLWRSPCSSFPRCVPKFIKFEAD